MRVRQIGLWILLAFATVACGDNKKADTTPQRADRSLYDRLGGRDAIVLVVDDFVANVVADDQVAHFFQNADAKAFKEKLVDQICEASGGPCKYNGVHKDMKTAHTGMKITDADFDAVVGDLVKALDKHGVPEQERGELLTALGGMKGDIVGQ